MRWMRLFVLVLALYGGMAHAEDSKPGAKDRGGKSNDEGKTLEAWADDLASSDPKVRERAIQALDRLDGHTPRTIKLLGHFLGDPSQAVRLRAYTVLTARGKRSSHAVEAAKKRLGEAIPAAPAERYVYRFLLLHDPKSVIRHKMSGVRASALEVARRVDEHITEAVFTLIPGRASKRYEPSEKVRIEAIRLLGYAYVYAQPFMEPSRKTVVQLLLAAAKDESPNIRAEAVDAMHSLESDGPPPIRRALLAAMKAAVRDEHIDVRKNAWRRLRWTKGEHRDLLQPLLAALDDPDLRTYADGLIARVGPLTPPLMQRIHHILATETGFDLAGTIHAVGDLGERGAPFVGVLHGIFRQAGNPPNPRNFRNAEPALLRDYIAAALGDIGAGAAQALADMETAFDAADTKKGGVYAYAMIRMGSTRREEALAHLVKVAIGEHLDILRAQAWLGRVGPNAAAAVAPLVEHAKKGPPEVTMRAAKTLRGMGGLAKSALPTLRAMLTAQTNAESAVALALAEAIEAIESADG